MSGSASEWENKWEADKVMIGNEEQMQSEMVKVLTYKIKEKGKGN